MTTQDQKALRQVHEVFSHWEQEDQQIVQQIDTVRDWMLQTCEHGNPSFAEAGERLSNFRTLLVAHFQQEDDLCDRLSRFYEQPCPEVDGMCRQATRDHTHLLKRLDQLVQKLKAPRQQFESFRAAVSDVGLLLNAIEQHEDYESESIRALMPSQPPSQPYSQPPNA